MVKLRPNFYFFILVPLFTPCHLAFHHDHLGYSRLDAMGVEVEVEVEVGVGVRDGMGVDETQNNPVSISALLGRRLDLT